MLTTDYTDLIFGRNNVTNVQPFTYQDGYTYLRILQDLIVKVNEMIVSREELDAKLEEFEKGIVSRIEAIEKRQAAFEVRTIDSLNTKFAALEVELRELVENMSVGGVCFDPTTGSRTTPISEALEHVYDNLRLAAMFTAQADEAGTAKERDELNQDARYWDVFNSWPKLWPSAGNSADAK